MNRSELTPLSLDQAVVEWQRCVIQRHPHVRIQAARRAVTTVIQRARILSAVNKLNFPEVAAFLLDRSLSWALDGKRMDKIEADLPKTLGDLGMLKIAEGGKDGEPLEMSELKRALAAPKFRLN